MKGGAVEGDARDRELLRRAAELRREAGRVLADLGLLELFASVGRAEVVGSASFGLALTRDIDFDILCRSLEGGPIWDALRPLLDHPRVVKVRWTDQRGPFNPTGRLEDEGLYCGIHYIGDGMPWELRWKLDCWFLPEQPERPTVALRERLRAATDEERRAILRLKDAGMRAGRYGPDAELHGHHVYEAVLSRGVRRYEDL